MKDRRLEIMNNRVRKIPRPAGLIPQPESPAANEGRSDFANSPYFLAPDFFTMKSGGSLTILTNYPTYQQTRFYSCGPAAALTVLWYFGETSYNELDLIKRMGSRGTPNERGEGGTNTASICKFFEEIGWNVRSTLSEGNRYGKTFPDTRAFRDFVISELRSGLPIITEGLCFGPHWRVIIGYDTMGTETTADDMVIFMDSDDVCDHCQDGYTVVSAEGFFHAWRDPGVLPPDQRIQQYIIVSPPWWKKTE